MFATNRLKAIFLATLISGLFTGIGSNFECFASGEDPASKEQNKAKRTEEIKLQRNTLKKEIDTLVASGSCQKDEECEALGVGQKPCGGPRAFVYFSNKTADSAFLKKKVAQYNELDAAFNKLVSMVSDCSLEEPKIPKCVSVGQIKRCEGR